MGTVADGIIINGRIVLFKTCLKILYWMHPFNWESVALAQYVY